MLSKYLSINITDVGLDGLRQNCSQVCDTNESDEGVFYPTLSSVFETFFAHKCFTAMDHSPHTWDGQAMVIK